MTFTYPVMMMLLLFILALGAFAAGQSGSAGVLLWCSGAFAGRSASYIAKRG